LSLSRLPKQNSCISSIHVCHMPCPSHSWFDSFIYSILVCMFLDSKEEGRMS
jgi:hypothetical protein